MLTEPAQTLFEKYRPFVATAVRSSSPSQLHGKQTKDLAEDVKPTASVIAETGSSEEVAPCPAPLLQAAGTSDGSSVNEMDVIHARVDGAGRPDPQEAPHEEVAVRLETEHIVPILNAVQVNTLSLDEDDLSDSGVFDSVDPGVLLPMQDKDLAVSSNEYWQLKNSCWLFGGGFLGGLNPHLKTPILN